MNSTRNRLSGWRLARDVLDILLIDALGELNYPETADAARRVFEERAAHAFPPVDVVENKGCHRVPMRHLCANTAQWQISPITVGPKRAAASRQCPT